MTPSSIDLSEQNLAVVKQILHQYIPQYEVHAFGSRVTHTAKKFSDLDLVIMTSSPLSLEILATLTEAFKNSELPIKIDILDWSRISNDFQKHIAAHSIPLSS